MSFTVIWDPDGRSELHWVWVASPDPAAVRSAVEKAEQQLSLDPIGTGEHICEGLWRIVVSPLAVYYTVDIGRQLVEITNVALTD